MEHSAPVSCFIQQFLLSLQGPNSKVASSGRLSFAPKMGPRNPPTPDTILKERPPDQFCGYLRSSCLEAESGGEGWNSCASSLLRVSIHRKVRETELDVVSGEILPQPYPPGTPEHEWHQRTCGLQRQGDWAALCPCLSLLITSGGSPGNAVPVSHGQPLDRGGQRAANRVAAEGRGTSLGIWVATNSACLWEYPVPPPWVSCPEYGLCGTVELRTGHQRALSSRQMKLSPGRAAA